MSVGAKFGLTRIAIFIGSAAVVWLFSPAWLDLPMRLMIALVISAVIAFFVQRRMRDELAEALAEHATQRQAKKDRLRAALAGEDPPA